MNEKNTVWIQNDVTASPPAYKEEIAQLLRGNLSPKLKRDRMLSYHENDVAASLALLSRDERRRLYSMLSPAVLAKTLEYTEQANDYIGELSIRKRVDILSRLETATAVDYLRQLDKEDRNALIELMEADTRQQILLLSSFDEDEIGSQMTTNYIAIRSGIGVRQAMKELISQAADNDNIATLYVVDEEDTFVGAIDLKRLIIAREGTELSTITMTSYPYVYAWEQTEDCIERIKEYSEDSIPVLDGEHKLRGVLTSQDIARLLEDERQEDYAKLAGLSAEEDLREPLRKSIGKRLPWLIVLLGLGFLVSGVVGLFEDVVAHLAVIVSFQSLILGMSGNAGTQSLAVTIRVLTNEQLGGKEKLYLIGKEARIGLIHGLILGSLSVLAIGGYLILFKHQPAVFAFSVSLCTGIALMLSILLSSISGTVIPTVFKKLKIDPAVASGPLITTLNDLVAVISYYGLAWMLLIRVLHL
ncbi:MAG: magnesium transporter [Clostridia bacterium]|nr:magnesium transporter [Clostridia bacterium]